MAAKPKANKTISGHSADIRSSDWLGSVSLISDKTINYQNETNLCVGCVLVASMTIKPT